MSGWLNQLQSLLGQKSGEGKSGLNQMLVPGALGGLAGLLIASKSSRKMLAKYGTGALLVGGGAVAGSVLWNKYKDKMRGDPQTEMKYGAPAAPLDVRTERLILALVFAAKSDGHIDAKEQAAIEQQLREAGSKSRDGRLSPRRLNSRSTRSAWRVMFITKKRRWSFILLAARRSRSITLWNAVT